MNLLDKASIILTASAYNNGEALCVKPSDGSGDFDFSRNSAATRVNAQGLVEDVQILSSNLVQNGDFSQLGSEEVSNGSFTNGETDWTLGTGWSVGEDKAVCSGHTSHTSLTQSNSFVSGKTYKISFDIIVDSGNFAIKLLGGGSDTGNTISSTQIGYTEYITPSANRTLFSIRSNDGNGIGSITNISVKEVGQNWVKDANWSIGDNVATSTGAGRMFQSISALEGNTGTKVKVSFNITEVTSGGVKVDCYGAASSVITEVGTHTFTGTTTNSLNLYINNSGTGNLVGSITNISVIEITDDTNLPRINYEGFSYQDALGSELVTNGDFSNGLANWVVDDGTSWTNVNDTAFCDGNNGLIKQNISSTTNKVYKVTFDTIATNSSPQELGVRIDNGEYAWNLYSTGTHTIYLTAGSSSTQGILFYANNGWTGSIDNVSVKEYSGQEVVPDSGCGSWLFEPQSTNLITYSEDFTQWNKSGSMVITPNNVISPDGTQNATLLTANSINQFIYLSSFSAANSTISLYIKRKSGTGDIELSNNGGSSYTVLSVTDEWSRVQLTFAAVTNQTVLKINTSGDEIYLWGAQVEQQSYATSYIPTSGTSVTRNQDVCNNGGSVSTINSTSGVLYAEIAALADDGSFRFIAVSDGTSSNRVRINYAGGSNQLGARVVSGGVTQSNFVSTISDVTDYVKLAISYKLNEVKFYINGSLISTDTSAIMPIGLSRLAFDDGSGALNFFGKTKCLAVWKETLSDEELAELTTI